MLNEDIAADLKAKAQRGEPGFEDHPDFRDKMLDPAERAKHVDPIRFAVGFNEYMNKVSRCAHEHGWWENGERNMGEMIALMHSELSEALEEYRNDEPLLYYTLPAEEAAKLGMVGPQKWEGPPTLTDDKGNAVMGKPEGLATEFADVIIRIMDTCATLGIPLTSALIHKAEYNLTRPYRHGGKLA